MVAVHDERTVGALHLAMQLAVHGVVLEHVGHVVAVDEGVVDESHLPQATRDTCFKTAWLLGTFAGFTSI